MCIPFMDTLETALVYASSFPPENVMWAILLWRRRMSITAGVFPEPALGYVSSVPSEEWYSCTIPLNELCCYR